MDKPTANSPDTFVCPWWLIHTFDNPLRRIVQKPEKLLEGIVRRGDLCLDLGCGFGYFTIPLARLVGPTGAVTAVDVQPQMLAGVRRRAEASGLLSRIQLQQADSSGLHLGVSFDFALAFWMMHEVPDQEGMLGEIKRLLKPGGRFMLAEPKGHVTLAAFHRTVSIAESVGFLKLRDLSVYFSRAVLMTNGTGSAG